MTALALAALPPVQFREVPDPWLLLTGCDIVVTAGAEAPAVRPLSEADVAAILDRFQEWMTLDVAEGHASPLTLAAYRADVRAHLHWLITMGVPSVAHVTLDTLKSYRAHLANTYKVTTARRKLASIRRFYALARAHGALPADPAAALNSPRDRTQRADRIKYLELEDVARLIAATATAHTPAIAVRDRCILMLMAYHGLRRCEIRRLDLADIELPPSAPVDDDAGRITVHGKGDKTRTLDLVTATAGALAEWLAVRRLVRPADEAVFVQLHWNATGPAGRLSAQAINAIVDTYLAATGLKKRGISCHTLRHTCAAQALEAGARLDAIGEMLGHVSLDTTRIYAQIVNRRRTNPARILSDRL